LFQSKLSNRNYDLNGPLNLIKPRCKNNKFALNYNYMDYFAVENYLFIAYQLLLIYLGLDAVSKCFITATLTFRINNTSTFFYRYLMIM
jgi:hypothetical protein